MKLPKNFGGQGLGNMMQQAKQAMERAKKLEEELENERIPIDKGPVKAIMDGTGQLVSIKIDPSVLDPEDVEALEDLVVSAVRDGHKPFVAASSAAHTVSLVLGVYRSQRLGRRVAVPSAEWWAQVEAGEKQKIFTLGVDKARVRD